MEVVRRILAGISCAAVSLLIAVVFRMATPLLALTVAVIASVSRINLLWLLLAGVLGFAGIL